MLQTIQFVEKLRVLIFSTILSMWKSWNISFSPSSVIFPLTTPELMAGFENAFWHMKCDSLYLEGATNTLLPPTEIRDTILYYSYLRNGEEIGGFSLNSFWYFVGRKISSKLYFITWYMLERKTWFRSFSLLAVFLEQSQYRVHDLKTCKQIKEETICWLSS